MHMYIHVFSMYIIIQTLSMRAAYFRACLRSRKPSTLVCSQSTRSDPAMREDSLIKLIGNIKGIPL